jgi:hypothetical protein
VLLTPVNILGPVAAVGILVVQQTANAQLFGGRSVPTGPISGAGCFMAEYTVQPVTVLGGDWSIWKVKNRSKLII